MRGDLEFAKNLITHGANADEANDAGNKSWRIASRCRGIRMGTRIGGLCAAIADSEGLKLELKCVGQVWTRMRECATQENNR